MKAGTISRAYRSTSAIATSLGIPRSTAFAPAASSTFGSYIRRSMRTWRLVRVKGRISRCSRFPISSRTMFTRRRRNQRTPGRSRRSTAARAASRARTATTHTGRVTCALTGSVYHQPMGYNPGREDAVRGNLVESKKNEAVVLVHGLWMTGREMRVLGGRLEEAGFRVRYFRYRSWRGGLARAGSALRGFVGAEEGERVRLAGHSLGGVVIAKMLEEAPLSRPGRVA